MLLKLVFVTCLMEHYEMVVFVHIYRVRFVLIQCHFQLFKVLNDNMLSYIRKLDNITRKFQISLMGGKNFVTATSYAFDKNLYQYEELYLFLCLSF